jgi:hypothetical protein
MPTLILSPRFSSDTQYLWRVATAAGWDVHRAIRYTLPETPQPWCVYGELSFCDVIAERARLALLEPANDWLAGLPYAFLKRDVQFMRLRDVHQVTERRFIKPANDKMFAAQVYERGSDVSTNYIDLECPVLVSEVVSFDAEVRCYVLDRKVVTASAYKTAAALPLNATKGGTAWLQHVLDCTAPSRLPSSVVIDVGLVHGRGWVVIEANQLYASGIYEEADGAALLPLLLRASGPVTAVRAEDLPFLRL